MFNALKKIGERFLGVALALLQLQFACGCPTFETTAVPACKTVQTSHFNRAGRGTVREAPGCPDNCQWNPFEFTPDGPYKGVGSFKVALVDTYTATCEIEACAAIKDWPERHNESSHKPLAEEQCQTECRARALTFREVTLLKKDTFHDDHQGDCETSCCPATCGTAVQRHMMWACVCTCDALPCGSS